MGPCTRPVAEDDMERAMLVAGFLRMRHEPRPASVAVGLGSVGVRTAATCAGLYHAGLAPLLVFSGANNPYTARLFPRGEAVHYRDHAVSLGVPASDVLIEPRATNTAENIRLTRELLHDAGIEPATVLLVAWFPRRPYATARKLWPDAEFSCVPNPFSLSEFAHAGIREDIMINILVSELHRIQDYAERGYIEPQRIPSGVRTACSELIAAGYDGRTPPPLPMRSAAPAVLGAPRGRSGG
ncbi:YdcF family protein [Streptomyces sp. NPDC006658]|uniref:YdcF family protein n=1 Tax=Streptomyces sp. NPDC006658 TaxID=3156900 RepID=UPI00340E73BF